MKINPSKLRSLAMTGAAGLTLVQATQAATILTGSGQANNADILADHGSDAVGTPDIDLLWSATNSRVWDAYASWPNGGGTGINGHAYQLDGPSSGYTGAATYSIAFTPENASTAVLLTSLDLNDWSGPATVALQNTTLNWVVTGSISGSLGSGTGLVVTNGTVQALNLGLQGVGGETLTLSLTPTGGSGSYFAIDNISFDQVAVPEPSGSILAAAGLGALALRRRRA